MKEKYVHQGQFKNMVGIEISEKINYCGNCKKEYDEKSPYFFIDRTKDLYLGFCKKDCLKDYVIEKME